MCVFNFVCLPFLCVRDKLFSFIFTCGGSLFRIFFFTVLDVEGFVFAGFTVAGFTVALFYSTIQPFVSWHFEINNSTWNSLK